MDTPSPAMRDLARRLLAASQTASDQHVHEIGLVSAKLEISLTKLVGAAGFASLVHRALVLASADVPALQSVNVDSRMEGFEQLAAGTGIGATREAAVAITAHLLGLLVTLIGEAHTLRLVCEAWPDTSLDE